MPLDDGRMTETCCGNNIRRGGEELLLIRRGGEELLHIRRGEEELLR
jgi:hypothetical protein